MYPSATTPSRWHGLNPQKLSYKHICVVLLLLQLYCRKLSWSLSSLAPQAALPSVPPDTKLSKLDVLVLATNYIAYLTETLDQGGTLAEHTVPSRPGGYLHPVKVRLLLMYVHYKGGGFVSTVVETKKTTCSDCSEDFYQNFFLNWNFKDKSVAFRKRVML